MAITIAMQPKDVQKLSPRIVVAGIGGAGGNAVNNMISSNQEGCEFLVCNADAQALENSLSDHRVQLGVTVTGGLGAGSKPEVGKAAAEESLDEVMKYFEGANMAFITAGMGGGTGTGAAPVIAKACRERGILTVGVVTKPFHFEGSHRMKSAEKGIEEMQEYVDTLIVIPNQNLFRVANEKTTFADAFQMADAVLQAGVRGVTDLMVKPGLVNLDFADIRTAMLEMGKAMMGTGEAEGEKRAIEAAESAINNPLLDDVSMKGAHGVIINVTGGYDMTLFEADEACNRIRDEVDPDANIIFGATFDASLEGKMRVSIVATGIDRDADAGRKTTGGSQPMERAQPKTQSDDLLSQAAPKMPTFMSAKAVKDIKAPAPLAPTPAEQIAARTGAPLPSRSIEPEADMYEQREFSTVTEGVPEIAKDTALRGTLYNNSFIPPKPMEAPSGAQHISSFHGAHVPDIDPQAVTSQQISQAGTSSGLRLNPPKAPTPSEARRSPSLFERITGTVQEHIGGFAGRGHEEDVRRERMAPSPVSSPSTVVQGVSTPASPSQGSLNIDAPSKSASASADDELDIPAFLRRQAN